MKSVLSVRFYILTLELNCSLIKLIISFQMFGGIRPKREVLLTRYAVWNILAEFIFQRCLFPLENWYINIFTILLFFTELIFIIIIVAAVTIVPVYYCYYFITIIINVIIIIIATVIIILVYYCCLCCCCCSFCCYYYHYYYVQTPIASSLQKAPTGKFITPS